MNKQAKVNAITRFALQKPEYHTDSGENLWNEIVYESVRLQVATSDSPFGRSLARDGFSLTNGGELRRTLPAVGGIPIPDDELHSLLDEFEMVTAKGHIDQAIKNHALGNWAAANSQMRAFLEEVFNVISTDLSPETANLQLSSENRRQKLSRTDPPFFRELLDEWSDDGKNFVNGVFKRLHAEGSHPGLSSDEDCTFRLHLVLIVANYFLRRAMHFKTLVGQDAALDSFAL